MTSLPDDLVLPGRGRPTLADLLPSVASHLSVPAYPRDLVGLPAARRYVVLLVDGLGDQLLRGALAHTGWFAEVYGDALSLTALVPSTTATSLTCLGTGLWPGRHGVAGYSFRAPGADHAMNALTWEGGPQDPVAFQPLPTVFERVAADGVAVATVGPARFEASGLTAAALRGPRFHAAAEDDDQQRVTTAVAASRLGDRSLVYVYERALDHTGHGRGVASQQWLSTLERVDAFIARLREELDDETCLLVTGDHGMVDVPAERHVLVEDEPGLLEQVDLFAGEGRLRQLFTRQPQAVAARWAQVLGERAHVVTRDQAQAEGWLGPVDERVRPHFGDVLVAMRQDWAVMTRALPRELQLVGQHGSLTAAEMLVPLLVDHPESW